MTSKIDLTEFVETEVIKTLKNKQNGVSTLPERRTDLSEKAEEPKKSNRGRKKKYDTDEERIQARRAQQKAYRERRRKELEELRALKEMYDKQEQQEQQEHSVLAKQFTK